MTNEFPELKCPKCGHQGLEHHHYCFGCGQQYYCPECKEVI